MCQEQEFTMSFSNAAVPRHEDPILTAFQNFAADTRPGKINLSVGMCYDEQGKIPLMAAVARAETLLAKKKQPWTYLMAEGLPALRERATELLFGASLKQQLGGRVASLQTLGGTGAVRLAGELAAQLWPQARVALSTPTWMNHPSIFQACGRTTVEYPYYDSVTKGVDFPAMLAAIEAFEPGTLVVLHGCCHNPTGADLTMPQWHQLAQCLRERKHVALLDVAYAGFGDGLDADMAPVRLLAQMDIPVLIALSFSKSFALYGERVGMLVAVTASSAQAATVTAMLKGITRTSHSTPPSHGGLLISEILGDSGLLTLWRKELEAMRIRIVQTRKALFDRLQHTDADLSFLNAQKGLFSYTGLSPRAILMMDEEFAVHAVRDGRICIAAINANNIEHVAAALDAALQMG